MSTLRHGFGIINTLRQYTLSISRLISNGRDAYEQIWLQNIMR